MKYKIRIEVTDQGEEEGDPSSTTVEAERAWKGDGNQRDFLECIALTAGCLFRFLAEYAIYVPPGADVPEAFKEAFLGDKYDSRTSLPD